MNLKKKSSPRSPQQKNKSRTSINAEEPEKNMDEKSFFIKISKPTVTTPVASKNSIFSDYWVEISNKEIFLTQVNNTISGQRSLIQIQKKVLENKKENRYRRAADYSYKPFYRHQLFDGLNSVQFTRNMRESTFSQISIISEEIKLIQEKFKEFQIIVHQKRVFAFADNCIRMFKKNNSIRSFKFLKAQNLLMEESVGLVSKLCKLILKNKLYKIIDQPGIEDPSTLVNKTEHLEPTLFKINLNLCSKMENHFSKAILLFNKILKKEKDFYFRDNACKEILIIASRIRYLLNQLIQNISYTLNAATSQNNKSQHSKSPRRKGKSVQKLMLSLFKQKFGHHQNELDEAVSTTKILKLKFKLDRMRSQTEPPSSDDRRLERLEKLNLTKDQIKDNQKILSVLQIPKNSHFVNRDEKLKMLVGLLSKVGLQEFNKLSRLKIK